jgi:hypothetical protein
MEHTKTSGIYLLRCTVNGKVYIGSSGNIYKRFRKHITTLNSKVHKNKNLQFDFNVYGSDAFEFEVLEGCPENELLEREKTWILKYNALNSLYGYNVIIPGGTSSIPFSVYLNITRQPRKPIIQIVLATGEVTRFAHGREVTSLYKLRYKRLQAILTYWKLASAYDGHKRMTWKGRIFVYEIDFIEDFDYIGHSKTPQKQTLQAVKRHLKLRKETVVKIDIP